MAARDRDLSLSPARRHILVVAADSADLRELVSRPLAGQHDVEVVGDAQRALLAIARHAPDLALVAATAPREQGVTLLAELRSRTARGALPIIILSEQGEEDWRLEALEAGADDYLIKPFSPRELLARVDLLLQRFGTGTDSTDLIGTQEALQRERDFSSAVLDTAGALVIVFDREGRITRFNHACEAASGWSAAEVLGRSFDFLIPPEQLFGVRETWAALLHGSFPSTYENHWVTKDGARILIAWSNTALLAANSAVTHIIGVGLDISERRRTEAALLASEQRLRALVTASTEVLYQMSPDWKELRQLRSDSFLVNTEHPSQSWLEAYIHPDDQPAVVATIEEAIQSKSVFELEHRVRSADGSLGWTFSRAVPLTDESGSIVEWFGAASDISERKRAEEDREQLLQALRDKDSRKSEFLAVLSHELRNPLAPIMNSLYILERAVPGGDQARRAQVVIRRQVDQLTRLVDDLLELTRLTRSKVQLQSERLELNELVQRTIEDHRSTLENAGLTVETAFAPEPVFVNGDRNRLAQVVGNLLQNAAKFTPAGGRASLSLAADEIQQRAVLRVADTGAGMAPDLLENLFQPFRQAKQSIERSKGGLGLGLALVKGLIELHGGEVWAHSAGVGQGSEFTVYLPLAVQPAAAPVAGRSPGPCSPHRVLVIEDNVDAAHSLREVLEFEGHEVAVAYDGLEGIAKAREFCPNLVLCDLGLPGMDGYAVARVLRADEALKDARLVALSGYAMPEDLQRAAAAGFERHLAKPPSLEKLTAVLCHKNAR